MKAKKVAKPASKTAKMPMRDAPKKPAPMKKAGKSGY